MIPRGRVAGWAAVTVAGVLLPLGPAVAGLRTLVQRDTSRLYAPVRTLVVEALRAGRLPLWNPYEAAGKPLFAEGIHSVLHPISLLGAAVAPASVDFLLLAYLVAAALGAFVLARALGASGPAAAGAGLAFALSGFTVSMVGNLVFLAGLATLPWVVAAARAVGAGSAPGLPATALAAACAFLAGDVQVALVGLALGALLAADAGGARGAARALGGMAVGVLLASIQIAATHELLSFSTRSQELSTVEKMRWALAPARPLEWVLPGLFRGPLVEVPTLSTGEPIEAEFSESVYLGVPILVAAGIGALRGRRRTGLVLAVAGGVCLWLALGHHLGARQVLDAVPVWNRFRYAEKLAGPLALCLCMLGALGIDAFGAWRLPRAARWTLTATAVVAAAASATLLSAPATAQAIAAAELGQAGPFYRSTLAAGLPHLVLGLVALLAVDRLRHERARVPALALLAALAPALALPAAAFLGSADARRVAVPMRLAADTPAPRVLQAAEGLYTSDVEGAYVDATARREVALLSPSTNVAQRIDTMSCYGAFEPTRLTGLQAAFGPGVVRAYRRFGLTHVIVPVPFEEARRDAVTVGTAGGSLVQHDPVLHRELWAVPHRPWAFFAGRAIPAALPEDAQRILLELVARGDDATVVVETSAWQGTAPGRVLRVERGTESVRIEAESEGPSLLVVQDAWWPGWRAFVDGRETEVLAADVLVRAVAWPAGRHTLELIYDPPAIRLGLALTGVGAVLVVGLVVVGVRGVRRQRATAGSPAPGVARREAGASRRAAPPAPAL